MDRIIGRLHWFGDSEVTNNQIFSMIALVVITFVLSILIYVAVKRQKVDKAPNGAIIMVESLISTSDGYANGLSDNRLEKANPYFISLFVFLFFGHLVSLLGFAPLGSALSAVFAATVITWTMTIGLGLVYQKAKYLLKLFNPLELAGNFSPLISLTFRMFGNIVGGVVLITLLHTTMNGLWIKIIKLSPDHQNIAPINPFSIIFTPWLNLYFDFFAGGIQAFVFMTLTISYWSQSTEREVKEKHKDAVKKIHDKFLGNEETETKVNDKVKIKEVKTINVKS